MMHRVRVDHAGLRVERLGAQFFVPHERPELDLLARRILRMSVSTGRPVFMSMCVAQFTFSNGAAARSLPFVRSMT